MSATRPPEGRGAPGKPPGRFGTLLRARDPEAEAGDSPRATGLRTELAGEVPSENDSPDLPFARALDPSRGREHGCIDCDARPSHADLGLSPGLDFETRILAKANAAERLRAALARPGDRVRPIPLGSNTDPDRPVKRRLRLTRSILEVRDEHRHAASLLTRSALVLRELDRLAATAAERLVLTGLSVPTLDHRLAARREPRAAAPHRRLAAASVPVGVRVAPIVPALDDHGFEAILVRAAEAGARFAGNGLIRLPHELDGLCEEWLRAHFPERAVRGRGRIREVRGGRLDDPRFFARLRGAGPFAALLAQRLRLARRRLGLAGGEALARRRLDASRFRAPHPRLELSPPSPGDPC